jgi:hypothetical protein
MAEPALVAPEFQPIYANFLRDFAPQFAGDDQRGLKQRQPPPELPPPIQGGNWVYPLP